jgi:hypothetical protein
MVDSSLCEERPRVSTENEIDAIASHITRLVANLGRAKHETLAAAEAVGATAQRTAAVGFAGIARRLDPIQRQLRDVNRVLDSATTEAQPIGEVTDRTSPHQVAARFTAAGARLTMVGDNLDLADQQRAAWEIDEPG